MNTLSLLFRDIGEQDKNDKEVSGNKSKRGGLPLDYQLEIDSVRDAFEFTTHVDAAGLDLERIHLPTGNLGTVSKPRQGLCPTLFEEQLPALAPWVWLGLRFFTVSDRLLSIREVFLTLTISNF